MVSKPPKITTSTMIYNRFALQEIMNISWSAFTTPIDGLSLLNEDGGLRVFFPSNSFVTNTTLTDTNNPRGQTGEAPHGKDHIVCYVNYKSSATVIWYNSSGVKLEDCGTEALCGECGVKCVRNGGVGVDGALARRTHIHMYIDSTAYVNQDLECKVADSRGQSAFIGVYLKDGGKFDATTHDWQIELQ